MNFSKKKLNIHNLCEELLISYQTKIAHEFVSDINVQIMHCDNNGEVKLGEMLVNRIRAGKSIDYGVEIFYEMDAHSQTLCNIYNAIFTDHDTFTDAIENSGFLSSNILHINYFCLRPEWRGKKLGKILFSKIIEELGNSIGGDLIVLNPYPLTNHPSRECKFPELNDFEIRKAIQKLRKYWMSIGFRPVKKGSPYMFMLSEDVI